MVHMMVYLATVLSGLTYDPVSLFFRFMGVAVGGPVNFYRTQRVYGQAIGNFYNKIMKEKLSSFKKEEGVHLIIDTRFDTPGKLIYLGMHSPTWLVYMIIHDSVNVCILVHCHSIFMLFQASVQTKLRLSSWSMRLDKSSIWR